MATTVLGLTNDYASLDTLPSADMNTLADSLEWVGAGWLSLSVAGSGTDALSAAQYKTSAIKFTGVLTGNRVKEFPAHAGRRWVIDNATSGSFTLTCKVTGQTGIVVRQGFRCVLYCDGTDIYRASPDTTNAGLLGATGDILDANGNEAIKIPATASAVDEITVTNAATGGTPSITATGDDTNIAVLLAGKGTGAVKLGQSTSVGIDLVADQPIRDSSANELVKFTKTASAVNEVTIANAATAGKPSVSATGGDTNISLELIPKGTGGVAIGSGGYGIKKVLGASTTIDPASIADGDDYAISVNVPGAVPGDLALGSLALLVTNDVLTSAHVHTADYVKVLLLNRTGGALDLGNGTINVLVFQI